MTENTTPPARDEDHESSRRRSTTYALWGVQGLLALLFLLVGGMKLIQSSEMVTAQSPVALPVLFVRFIGVAEVLGALGLVLPSVTGIRQNLTPLAATGLVIIMCGATVLTLVSGAVAPAIFPLVVGLLAAFVAYGHWNVISNS
ncbi:DoxX family protein [Halocatena marina]|uniref:DoxX family protein n=1 Tax=Halocatena marina TaxID=2934937 RepID=A0ABD5YI96_9EURY|nr:DoxX family protein [Halocatena marina]